MQLTASSSCCLGGESTANGMVGQNNCLLLPSAASVRCFVRAVRQSLIQPFKNGTVKWYCNGISLWAYFRNAGTWEKKGNSSQWGIQGHVMKFCVFLLTQYLTSRNRLQRQTGNNLNKAWKYISPQSLQRGINPGWVLVSEYELLSYRVPGLLTYINWDNTHTG